MNSPRQNNLLGIFIAIGVTSFATGVSAQTLDRIKETGTINIGVRADSPPFAQLTEGDEPSGFSVELCNEIVIDVKNELQLDELTVNYIGATSDGRFDAIVDGDIDLLCGSATITLERRESVSFSIPIFRTGVTPVMRADASEFLRSTLAQRQSTLPPRARVMQAFEDRKFGVLSGTTAETWMQGSIDKLASNAELVTLESYDEALDAVRSREIDAFFGDRAILIGLVLASEEPSQFVIGERLFTNEPYGLAMTRGDEDFRLLVDRSLSRVFRTGEVAPMLERYFGRIGRSAISQYLVSALPE